MMDNNQTNKEQKFEIDDTSGKWYGQEVNTQSDPIIDPGTGKPLVLRYFEFSFNPEIYKAKIKPTKQELFNHHWRQIEVLLWGDGLVPRKDVDPRVQIGKGKSKGKYRIFILAEPRLGTFIAEKPQTIQQITQKKRPSP